MTPQDLQTMIDFHYWATHRVLAAVDALSPEQFTRDLGNSFRSVRDTLSHLQGSELIWLSRLQGTSPAGRAPHERFTDMAAVRAAWAESEAALRFIAGALDADGVERVLEYHMLDGQPTSARTSHILQHMVNHGTYHRGQVTTMLRQLGAAPPASLDLITFFRGSGR